MMERMLVKMDFFREEMKTDQDEMMTKRGAEIKAGIRSI
jgi:hypothetical protein